MPLSGEYVPSADHEVREHVERYLASGGAEGAKSHDDKPVVLLTTIGAKTGRIRKIPLMRIEHQGQYAVVASFRGASRNPFWYYNIKKHPRIELQDGTTIGDFDAREVFGNEKAAWWQRAVAALPEYSDYQFKTDREIPVFVLTPAR